jgi:hypothetical protein
LERLSIEIGRGLRWVRLPPFCTPSAPADTGYPWWVSMLGNAGVGVGVVLLLSTSWQILLITLMSGCLLDRCWPALPCGRTPIWRPSHLPSADGYGRHGLVQYVHGGALPARHQTVDAAGAQGQGRRYRS